MSGPRPAARRHSAARRFHRIPCTVTVRRPPVYDSTADPSTIGDPTVVHTGVGHVDTSTANTETEQAAAALTVHPLRVHVELAADVEIDDTVTFDTSDDPALAGRVGTVVDVGRGDWLPTRPLTVELVTQEVS